ncbi:LiaF domain-containing protein [Rhodococcus sp. X156]|uniref:LiaF domain-containing protein n=1 Tax=Rhodococcus sp. X156 TaxID=2499145 RepID=UPI000FD83E84|nr:LiaF domain-containing protein [Rhodococcus sp. X156]
MDLSKRSDERPARSAPIVAVFGGTERRGRWRPAQRVVAVALFGGVTLDLREAELPPDVLDLQCYAAFGGVQVTVPEGTRVEMTGFSLFGGRSVTASGASAVPGAPVIRLRAVAFFGGVEVTAKPSRHE